MNFLSIVNLWGGEATTTSHASDEDDSLLEIIPDHKRTRKQVAYWLSGDITSTYKLRKQPKSICEFSLYGAEIAIWMENKTLVYVSQDSGHPHYRHFDKKLELLCILDNPTRYTTITITGDKDDDIADAAMYWWGLPCPEECNPCIEIRQSINFEFGAVKTKHLAALFANNQNDSVFLATRKYPIDVTFESSYGGSKNELVDGGDAFVDGLQTRDSQFGSLHVLHHIPLSDVNIERLVQLKKHFDKLTLCRWNSPMALLPFSAPVRALNYAIDLTGVLVADIPTLNIVAEDLTVEIRGTCWRDGMNFITSLFARLENLGHFKHLGLRIFMRVHDSWNFNSRGHVDIESDKKQILLKALVRTITSNQKLESLHLHMSAFLKKEHVEDFIALFDSHKGLRTITIEILSDGMGKSDRPWLIHLLSRNRRIEVRGNWMSYIMKQQEIHSFNRVHSGCESVKSSSQDYRTMLVGTALTENACGNFWRSAFWLAYYPDSLCEFVRSIDLDNRFSEEHAVTEDRDLTLDSTDGDPNSNTYRSGETSAA